MKEDLEEERAIDTVGRTGVKNKSYGKVGGEEGSSKKSMDKKGSTEGIGGGLHADAMKEEAIVHEASYRKGLDKNEETKAETGTPRQEASYQNRDRAGSGLNDEPVYQRKFPSYPKSGPKGTKKGEIEDD